MFAFAALHSGSTVPRFVTASARGSKRESTLGVSDLPGYKSYHMMNFSRSIVRFISNQIAATKPHQWEDD